MATQVIAGQSVWFGAYDLGAYARSMVLDYGAELQDDTRIADTARKRVAGVKTCGFSFETVNDSIIESAINASIGEDVLNGAGVVQVTKFIPITVAPNGASAGDLAYILHAQAASYTPIAGAHGDPGKVNVAGFGDNFVRGALLFNGSVSATFDGTAYDYGSVPSSQTAYVSVHCTSFSGTGAIFFTLESSDDLAFTSPIEEFNVNSVSNTTGIASRTASAPIGDRRYWRISGTVVTGTPTATCVVAFGII